MGLVLGKEKQTPTARLKRHKDRMPRERWEKEECKLLEGSALSFTSSRAPLLRTVAIIKTHGQLARQPPESSDIGRLLGLSQYLLSCLGDNWQLAVTATAVGTRSIPHREGIGLVFIC